jgi:uncharacterized RDD family membrane protein YckC
LLTSGLGNFFKNIGAAIVVLILYCLYWGYFAFFEIIWNGQTPGKRLVGIRVIKESGRPITVLEAIGRNIFRAIDMLPSLYVVGIVSMLLNSRNKRLGDFVAGTVLVHDKKVETVNVNWKAGDSASMCLQTDKITPEELFLIESYLNRRREFDPPVRKKTARDIVSTLKAKAAVEPAEGQSDDDFLEALARKVRDTARFR